MGFKVRGLGLGFRVKVRLGFRVMVRLGFRVRANLRLGLVLRSGLGLGFSVMNINDAGMLRRLSNYFHAR